MIATVPCSRVCTCGATGCPGSCPEPFDFSVGGVYPPKKKPKKKKWGTVNQWTKGKRFK